MRSRSNHHGWDKARAFKKTVLAASHINKSYSHHHTTSINNNFQPRINNSERRILPQTNSNSNSNPNTNTTTNPVPDHHYRSKTSASADFGLNSVGNRRNRADPIFDSQELLTLLPNNKEYHTNNHDANNYDTLEKANFELSTLTKQCKEQQSTIDVLLSNIQLLQQEDKNRMNEVRNSLDHLKSTTRKYDEDATKKFKTQQDVHARRVKRMEGAMLKNIKNQRDRMYRSHATYVAQQNINIQETIDRTSGQQRRIIISLTSKGFFWLAMGAMTIIGPCFKLLRCCGVRKAKLSEFANYMSTDSEQLKESLADVDSDEEVENE